MDTEGYQRVVINQKYFNVVDRTVDTAGYQNVVVPDVGPETPLLGDTRAGIPAEFGHPLDQPSSPSGTAKTVKRRAVKNLLVISLCLMMLFTSIQGLSNLQSTMNGEGGLGVDSLAVVYAVSMVSSTFLPALMIRKMGCKTTVTLTMLSTIPYVAANLYPTWRTLMTTAAIMGVAMGPLSTSVSFYVGEMAYRFEYHDTNSLEAVTARFFGIYSFFSENTQIWGNLISYIVLRPGLAPIHDATNVTDICGINFQEPEHFINYSNPNLKPPSDLRRYTLVGLYLGFTILAVILLNLILDPLGNDKDNLSPPDGERTSCFTPLLAAVRHLKNPNQILLLPITIYCGMEIAFYTSDVTKAYIACSWGVHHVGFVTMCFGSVGAIMALLVGPLVKYLGQVPVTLAAATINAILCGFLFVWEPNPKYPLIFFTVAGAWGATDAIWWSQVPAVYGQLFKDDPEASFSNFYFWIFLGLFLTYFFSSYLTLTIKLNILLFFLIFGVICYLALQIRVWKSRRHYVPIEDS